MLKLVLAMLAILAATPVAAAEESGGQKTPIDQMVQFMRTEANRPQVWLVSFKIMATHGEDLNKVHIALPRIVDSVIVRLSSGENAARRPELAEIKQTITDSIIENVGQIEGLDVTIQRLGRV
jgi:hypothetical protein